MNRKYCSGALDLQDISENIKWHTKNILEAERQAPQVTECTNTVQSLGIWVFNLKNLSKSESSLLLWIGTPEIREEYLVRTSLLCTDFIISTPADN